MRYFLALVFVLIFCGQSNAVLKFPPLTGRVVDDANILSPLTKNTLTQLLTDHEAKTTNQIVVVTLPSLQNNTIEDYGYQLGRAWGIGQKGKNNGVILLIAPKEHKVRIEVGYGLEGKLTDAVTSQIIQQIILPQFKTGYMQQGIIDGTRTIVSVLEGQQVNLPTPTEQPQNRPTNIPPWAIIAFIIFIFFIRLRFGILFLPLGSFGGSSSGSSFSGGGGSFGGGGSSGSW